MPISLKNYSPLHASLIFLALAWVLPFLQWHHKLPIPSFFSEWLAFGLGLLAALPLLSRRYWEPMHIPRSMLFLLGFIGILIVQVVLERVAYPQQAFVAAMYILWGALMLWLGNQLGRELGLSRIAGVLAWALLVGAAISAALGLIQHFGLPTPLNSIINKKMGGAVMANLGQPNHLSNYLALGLASTLYLCTDGKLNRWVALGFGALLLFVLALTGSRSSWLYLGAFSILAWVWGRRSSAPGPTLLKVALGMLLAFALMQWLAHLPQMQGVTGTITSTERLFELASGVDVRLGLWREAVQIGLAHPLIGAGFGQFAWQHFMLASESAITQAAATLLPSPLAGAMYNHSHNLLTQIGAEFGGAGLLLLLVGAGYWLAGKLRQPATMAGWWVAAVLAVLTIHSLLEYPLWYAPFLGIAAILIGAADTHTLRLQLSGLMRAAFGLMLVLGWISLVRIADTYSQLEGLFRAHQAPPSVQEIERVLQHVRHESMLTPYSDFAYAAALAPNRAQSEDLQLLNRSVMRFAPTQEVVYRQALLLALQGSAADAQVMLKRALAMYPGAAENFLTETRQLEPEARRDVESLLDTVRIFLQEQKKHAIYPK
ncbi:MAG: O-antigen ligase C-terminal domain-containing protein [Burkholderiales bacterium]|nr:O-antigen ligase C-terminal domain-containing protein [Burkholderiales bacterium]